MNRLSSVALGVCVVVAAGLAHAEKFGASTLGGSGEKPAQRRDMPSNDDFQSITFRAGAGGSSPGCCPVDLNCDGLVDAADLASLLSAWGPCVACPTDFDADGIVGASDLAIMLSAWGPCAG